MSEELRDVILSTGHRVIAVVINAIDDRLANAAQIRDNWTINRITPLGALLRLARDSGRVVILASDHGHVWHRADAEYEPSSEGSRWRKNDGKCADGEIVVTGKRVLPEEAEGSVIVPWSEKIHYKRPHHGYHGGATPKEMVCPLIVHPLFGVAGCCGAIPQPKAAGRYDDEQRRTPAATSCTMAALQPSLDHTLKEGTNHGRCRFDDLRETFTFLELSFALTNPQMKTPKRLVYKHFAAIEMACESNFNSSPL